MGDSIKYRLFRRESFKPRNVLLVVSSFILALFIYSVMRQHIIWTIAIITGGSLGLPLYDQAYTSPLKFSRDGKFRITVFEDLHFGEGEDNPPEWGWGPPSDMKTTKVMNTILNIEKPDLVVLNGDLITGENTYYYNSTTYLDIIAAPMVQRRIPWASTYGNHDHQFNLSSDKLLAQEQHYPRLSLTQDMIHIDDAGTSNYVLPVFGSRSEEVPKLLLWFFDSRGGENYQKTGEAKKMLSTVHDAAVRWFRRTNKELKLRYNRVFPSLAFVHIPVYATAAFQQVGVDPERQPGINDDNPLAMQGLDGDKYTEADIPFMTALLETEGLKAVFSGHDHGDDWCHRWDRKLPGMNLTGNGLIFCFGRHTGYGGYGRWTRGSRQLFLDEKRIDTSLETWIRLEDGNMSGYVVLNATFGRDRYPKVNN